MAKEKEKPARAVATNRRGTFDYEIIERIEAGVELTGGEVKSLREGGASLAEAYAMPKKGQFFLVGLHIKPWQGTMAYAPEAARDRRLLLHKKEIGKLAGAISRDGMTIIPLKIYFNERGWAKVLIGLARGKKQYDKRETIKRREQEREVARDYKTR